MPISVQTAEALMAEVYDPRPRVEHHRTSISSVFLLTFPDGQEKILKANDHPSRSDWVRREQRVLGSLRAAGLAVSEIELTQADLPNAPFAFSVMPRRAVHSLSERYERDPSLASPLFVEAGVWLAELHRINPVSIEHAVASDEARVSGAREREWIREQVSDAELTELGTPALFATFEELQDRERWALIHGDYHAGQVMISGGKISYVVDWDWAQHGRPMRDLGLFVAYTRFYSRAMRESAYIYEGYRRVRPLSESEVGEAQLWELYTLLRVTAGQRLVGNENNAAWGIGLIEDLVAL